MEEIIASRKQVLSKYDKKCVLDNGGVDVVNTTFRSTEGIQEIVGKDSVPDEVIPVVSACSKWSIFPHLCLLLNTQCTEKVVF